MSVRQAQRDVDSREFMCWMAYARENPMPAERQELQLGILCSLVAGAFGVKDAAPAKYMPTEMIKDSRPKSGRQIMHKLRGKMGKMRGVA